MANTKKFIVKNGVQAPNITFKDSNTGATITATMNDSTDTLSFEGDAGQLFSITDGFDGTIFSVNDISGIPSIEVDDQGIIKLAEYNGKVLINTTDSGSTDSDVLVVGGNITTHTGSVFFDSAGNSARLQLSHLLRQSSDVLRIQTSTGSIDIGPQNTGFAHIETDRAKFWFGNRVMFGSNDITSYNGDFTLSRAENSTHKIVISDSDTQIHNGVLRIDQDAAPSNTADKLYNVGGSLFWNGTDVTSGGTDSGEILTVAGTGSLTGVSGGFTVNGLLSATTKSFDIGHPTKEGMRLRYGSLEGPENGVYVRGRLKNQNIIELPDYWTELVHEDTITVELTPMGKHQKLYVKDISNNMINIGNGNMVSKEINCFYIVYGERKDVEKIEVEYED